MFCTTLESASEVVHEKLVNALREFITDRSTAVVFMWFFVAWFWCQSFYKVSPYMCSYYLSSDSVAEWPPFGK